MSANLPSLDQILAEVADRLEDLTPGLMPAEVDEVVKSSLEAVAVIATMPTFAVWCRR